MRERGAAAESVHFIVNGVDLEEHRAERYSADERRALRAHFGLAPDRRVVAFFARLHQQKRPMDFIELARQFAADPTVVFFMVGEGPLGGVVAEQIERLGLPNIVQHPFHKPFSELLAVTDLMVLPSEYEGMPMVILEALAMGVPVVATDVGNNRDVLERSGGGVVVPVGDVGALRRAVQQMLAEPPSPSALRAAMERHFQLGPMAEAYYRAFTGAETPDEVRGGDDSMRILDTARRLLGRQAPASEDAKQYPGVFGRIHRSDLMIGGTTPEMLAVYVRIGTRAYAVIENALAMVGRGPADVTRALDFGCGYGRVLRTIVQNIPPSRVDVFDVDQQAVAFCAREFGVTGLTFARPWDWSSVPFGTYDLIWAGSVFTHLGEAFTRETLDLWRSLLRPGGVLVFTTHGEEAIRRAESGFFDTRYQVAAPRVRADYEARGFCFLPYDAADFAILPYSFERRAEFGMTWMSEDYIAKLVGAVGGGDLQLVRFVPKAWEGVQDAAIVQRSADPSQSTADGATQH